MTDRELSGRIAQIIETARAFRKHAETIEPGEEAHKVFHLMADRLHEAVDDYEMMVDGWPTAR
jgi:hypothetical protein